MIVRSIVNDAKIANNKSKKELYWNIINNLEVNIL
jgi:hypothetical protein